MTLLHKQELLSVVVMTLLLLPYAITMTDAQQPDTQQNEMQVELMVTGDGIFTRDAQRAVAIIREGVSTIDAQRVVSITPEWINTEARAGLCACIPHWCCCGPMGEPCHWCPGPHPC
jgi:hypothetical protein